MTDGSAVIRAVRADELGDALRYALATPMGGKASADGERPVRLATASQVQGFKRYLADTGATWSGWVAEREGALAAGGASDRSADGRPVRGRRRWTAVWLNVTLPGRTAIVLPAPPTAFDVNSSDRDSWALRDSEAVGAAAVRALDGLGLHYAQALTAPNALEMQALLRTCGFRRLTRLEYLERDVRHPWLDGPPAGAAEWVEYLPAREARFAALLQETYRESGDCPELNGLRPIEDVLAAHRAAGRFDPRLWQIAEVGGADAGCVLLSRLADPRVAELSYMGVHPAHRRKGVGTLLLRRALELCRGAQIERVTLVVDDRNAAARAMYARAGWAPYTAREAYVRRTAC
jgi:RimJ/RimL family protein N-acetyltransferase